MLAGRLEAIVRASKDLMVMVAHRYGFRGKTLIRIRVVIARASLVGLSTEHKRNRRRNDGVYE